MAARKKNEHVLPHLFTRRLRSMPLLLPRSGRERPILYRDVSQMKSSNSVTFFFLFFRISIIFVHFARCYEPLLNCIITKLGGITGHNPWSPTVALSHDTVFSRMKLDEALRIWE